MADISSNKSLLVVYEQEFCVQCSDASIDQSYAEILESPSLLYYGTFNDSLESR